MRKHYSGNAAALNVSPFARTRNICCGNIFVLRKVSPTFPRLRRALASATWLSEKSSEIFFGARMQKKIFPQQMFPVRANGEIKQGNNASATMFPEQ